MYTILVCLFTELWDFSLISYFHAIFAGVEKCGSWDCLGIGEIVPALQEHKPQNLAFRK